MKNIFSMILVLAFSALSSFGQPVRGPGKPIGSPLGPNLGNTGTGVPSTNLSSVFLTTDGAGNIFWATIVATATNAISSINGLTTNIQFLVISNSTTISNVPGVWSFQQSNVLVFPYASTTKSGILDSNDYQRFSTNLLVDEGSKLYVRVNGNDSTGMRGRVDKAFLTIKAAKNAASAGDTIIVGPGTYNEFQIIKNGVNLWLDPGTLVTNFVGNASGGFGIIDDRTNGPIVSTIDGFGTFKIGGDPNVTNFAGAIVVTNRLSRLTVRLNSIIGSWPAGIANQGFAALSLKDGTNFFDIQRIDSDNYLEPINGDGFNGIFWEDGLSIVRVRNIRVDGYCYWGEEPSRKATNDIFLVGEKWTSGAGTVLYHDGDGVGAANPHWKAWAKVTEIISETSLAASVGAYVSGKLYVEAEKISAAPGGLALDISAGTPEMWVTAQKITGGARILTASAGNLYAYSQQWETIAGNTEALYITGGTNRISGDVLESRAGRAIYHDGGVTRIQGLTVDSRYQTGGAITNFPVQVAGAGLTLQNVSLLAPVTFTNTIGAYSAQTVVVDGIISSTGTNNSNATLQGGLLSAGTQTILRLPTGNGSNGQVMTNNGSGVLGWWTITGVGGGGPVAVTGTNGPFRTSLFVALATNNPIYVSTNSVFVGDYAGTNIVFTENGTFIGHNTGVDTADSKITNVVVLGTGARAQGNGQFIVGTNLFYGYFGQGFTNRTPTGFEFHTSSGLGANDSGGNMVLAAGQGTGLGQGGNITVRIAPPGAGSGSGLNSFLDALVLSNITALLHVKSNIVLNLESNKVLALDTDKKFSVTPLELATSFAGIADGHGLVYNAAMGKFTNGAVGGSGEINTASSLGNGLHLFSDKNVFDLRFNTISNLNDTIQIHSNNNVFHFAATNIGEAQFIAPGNTFNIMYNTNDTIKGSDVFNLVFEADGSEYLNLESAELRLGSGTQGTYIGPQVINVSNASSFTIGLDDISAVLSEGVVGSETFFPTPNIGVDLGTTNFSGGNPRMWRKIFGDRIIGTNYNIYDSIRFWQTLGAGYNEFTGTNLASLVTNRFHFSFGSNTLAAGQVLKLHSSSIVSGVNTMVLTNDSDLQGGGGAGLFNVNQFLASSTHTNIKDGALFTNVVLHGGGNLISSNLGIAGTITNFTIAPALSGTNYLMDAKFGSFFTIKAPAGGVTTAPTNYNLYFTNVSVGQPIVAQVYITNCNTVRLWYLDGSTGYELPAAQYRGGNAISLASNCLSTIIFYRDTASSNIVDVYTKEFELASSGGIVLHTNFTSGVVTVSNSIPGGSNFVIGTFGTLHLTNQLIYEVENFHGLQNATNFDFTTSIIKQMTNTAMSGADKVYALTNATAGRTMVVHLNADTLGTNYTVKFTNANNANSTAILWRSPTNGNYDFILESNFNYTVFFTVLTNFSSGTRTNILAQWSTDSTKPIKGAAFAVATGYSSTNAYVGGVVYVDATTYTTNHSGAGGFTNLFTWMAPANALTNLNDELKFDLEGNFRSAYATTNEFKAIYGTSTLFDTGFITASNCTWQVNVDITRTGNSAQRVGVKVDWIVNGTSQNNGTRSIWATNMTLAEVNGVTNWFALQGASRIASVITNDYRQIVFSPGPR